MSPSRANLMAVCVSFGLTIQQGFKGQPDFATIYDPYVSF
jgi:hypothetical protein